MKKQPGRPRGGFSGALGCVFADPSWINRYWIVPVLILLPVVNLILLRGWRFELMRSLVWQRSPSLPDPARFFHFLGKGLLLWLMTFVYHLPHLAFGLLHFVQLTHAAGKGGEALVKEFVLVTLITIVFTAATWPLYLVAVLRYAATGSLSAFLLVPQNLWLVLRHYPRLVLLGLSVLLVTVVHFFLLGVLTATVIGLFVALLATIPIYYAATGHLYAQMAARMAATHRWLLPVEPGAEDGPRKPRPVGGVRVIVGLFFSSVFLISGVAAAVGIALLMAGPTTAWSPEIQALFDALKSGDWAAAVDVLRGFRDTWSQPETWRSLAPEWLKDQIDNWINIEDTPEAPADSETP
ncbi:MAG: DUF4013 domain-containing protein [Planctomycetota bacterium]